MPHITFMIGNGFDLQLGLDTRYDQFLSWYIQQPSASENIKKYKKALSEDRQSPWWTDAEIAMGKHISSFTTETMPDYYEQIRDFKVKLAEYLEQQDKRCRFADRDAIGKSFAAFVSSFQEDILLPRKVSYQFSHYDNSRYSFVTFNYTSVLNKLIQTLGPDRIVYKTNNKPSGDVYGKIDNVIPVHGTLSTSLIMGVNDEEQIAFPKDKITPKLKRTLIKPIINSALGRSEEDSARTVISNSSVIAIYGLKLGETDIRWKACVAKWLENDRHYVVIFDHHKLEGVNKVIPEDILDYVHQKQDAFLKQLYLDISEEQIDSMRDRVFVIDKTRYLDFDILSDLDAKNGGKTGERETLVAT